MLKTSKFAVSAVSAVGVSTGVQALAFFRQILIASYFGVSRELDVYVIAYALATMVVFTFANTFDAAVVPRLVQARGEAGEERARALSASMFRWSLALGVGATVLLIALTPLLTPLVATGFGPAQKVHLWRLVVWFAPWTLLSLPYYAAAARQKAQRRFNRVFGAEIVVAITSIAVLALFHGRIELLPIAYAVGYAAGVSTLLPGSGLVGAAVAPEAPSVLRGVGELYAANQTGALSGIVDRHFQSLVQPGGIAAVNYSAQIVTGLAGLLTLREIYIVPLSESERREQKLERLVIGLLMLAVPAAGVVSCFSHEMIQILFQRGRFDASATELTASVLRIYAFALIPSAIAAPMTRMLQIVGRTRAIHAIYIAQGLACAVFGSVLVTWARLDAEGVAGMLLAASLATSAAGAGLVARYGVVVSWWRIGKYFGYAVFVTAIASAFATGITAGVSGPWSRLILGGAAYGTVVALTYFAVRRRLRTIAG